MRFTKQKELQEDYWARTKKTKTKFLWWPLTIDGETRWLEKATIEYMVKHSKDIFCDSYYHWQPWKFLNK